MLIDKSLDLWDHLLLLVVFAVIFVSAFQVCTPALMSSLPACHPVEEQSVSV